MVEEFQRGKVHSVLIKVSFLLYETMLSELVFRTEVF